MMIIHAFLVLLPCRKIIYTEKILMKKEQLTFEEDMKEGDEAKFTKLHELLIKWEENFLDVQEIYSQQNYEKL